MQIIPFILNLHVTKEDMKIDKPKKQRREFRKSTLRMRHKEDCEDCVRTTYTYRNNSSKKQINVSG